MNSKRIVDYDVVESIHVAALVEKVNKAKEDRWQPYGNIISHRSDPEGFAHYVQVIVRYDIRGI